MNTQILCILSVFAAQAETDGDARIPRASAVFNAALRGENYRPAMNNSAVGVSGPLFRSSAFIVRGQNTYDEDPVTKNPATPPVETFAAPPEVQGTVGQSGTYPNDPFMGQPPGGPDPFGGQSSFGVFGPQPYRFGWSSRYDAGYLFSENTKGTAGTFAVAEANAALRYSAPLVNGMVFSWTPEFNSRSWSGPSGVALPAQVYRLASDFEIATQGPGPWSGQFGFTPAAVSDFQKSLNRQGYTFDGRAVIFYRAAPELTLAFGALYWNRVKDYVLPYAGVIWTPDDQWELRLMFPKSRISYFVGNSMFGTALWLYASGEYNVEAYQVNIADTGVKDRIELSDYRLMLGLRSEGGGISSFVEGGYVIDRHVRFQGPTPGFSINNGPMVRAGIRF